MVHSRRLKKLISFLFLSILILSGCNSNTEKNIDENNRERNDSSLTTDNNHSSDINDSIITIDNNITETNITLVPENNSTDKNDTIIIIDNNITEANTTITPENNHSEINTGNNISDQNTTLIKDTDITGKVIDGELSGATIFFDLNLNSELDTDEPKSKTKEDGSFTLILNPSHQKHQNYLNQTAPLIAFGGQDIRTDEIFEDYLMSMTEGKKSVNITPLTTLIAQSTFDELSKKSNKISQKNREEVLSSVQEKIDAIKEKLSQLFGINKILLTKNPITLAKEGDSQLINTSLQIHKASQSMKKAMKKEVKDLKKSILSNYRALGKELKQLDKKAIKGGESPLSTALNLAMMDNNLFDSTLVESVKKETKEIIKNIDEFWKEQKDIIDDDALTNAIKNSEEKLITDNIKPTITLLGDSTVHIIKDSNYSDAELLLWIILMETSLQRLL